MHGICATFGLFCLLVLFIKKLLLSLSVFIDLFYSRYWNSDQSIERMSDWSIERTRSFFSRVVLWRTRSLSLSLLASSLCIETLSEITGGDPNLCYHFHSLWLVRSFACSLAITINIYQDSNTTILQYNRDSEHYWTINCSSGCASHRLNHDKQSLNLNMYRYSF